MNTDRIKEIQQETAYPESVSVQQALLKVWNECEQEQLRIGAVSGQLEAKTNLMNKTIEERAKELYPNCDPVDKLYSALIEDLRAAYIAGATENISAEAGDGWTAVEFHEWVGKQGYKLSHYAAQGEAIHLHESAGSTPFHELREGDWLTTSELYDLFKQSQSKSSTLTPPTVTK